MIIRGKAPLRLSFAGGGTDVSPYPETEGGCVLNATIDSFAWGSLTPRVDGEIHIESADLDISASYSAGNPLTESGDLDLVTGTIRRLGAHNSRGFDIFLHTDAPPGSGLGSSSALVVALVGLVKEFLGLALNEDDVARLAYRIEREDLAIRGGLQDQYAASFGGFNFIEFHGDQVIVNALRISPDVINELEHNLLLCYTGHSRRSDSIITDQVLRFESRNRATIEALRYQKQLAVEMKDTLLRRRLDEFGSLLHTAWEAKKHLSPRISNSQIDALYQEARTQGALGGKITGAGGGGYMLLYCQFERKHKVAEAMRRMGAIPKEFAFERRGLQTWTVNNIPARPESGPEALLEHARRPGAGAPVAALAAVASVPHRNPRIPSAKPPSVAAR